MRYEAGRQGSICKRNLRNSSTQFNSARSCWLETKSVLFLVSVVILYRRPRSMKYERIAPCVCLQGRNETENEDEDDDQLQRASSNSIIGNFSNLLCW